MSKQNKNKSKAQPKVAPKATSAPKADPNSAKVYETIARNIKNSARESEDLNDISKDLSSTWSDLANAITLINKNSGLLGSNFSKVEQLTKNIYANIEDVGSEYYKQIDTSEEMVKLQEGIFDNSNKILDNENELTKLFKKKIALQMHQRKSEEMGLDNAKALADLMLEENEKLIENKN